MSLNIDTQNAPSRRCNNHKYTYIKHWHTQFHKRNTTRHKRIGPHTIILGDFNIHSYLYTDHPDQTKEKKFRVKL
jgi:exonuclease III